MSTTTETDLPAEPYQGEGAPGDDLDALLEEGAGDDTDLDEGTDDTESGATPSGTLEVAAARTKSATNRALIRRVANKAAELQAAPKSRKDTLASVLGSGTDLGGLTYAVMTADRTALAAVVDLTAIAEEDPWGAAVTATTQGRTRMRAVWALLLKLNVDVPAAIPPSDAKAGIALARACHQLKPDVRDELTKVVALARKS